MNWKSKKPFSDAFFGLLLTNDGLLRFDPMAILSRRGPRNSVPQIWKLGPTNLKTRSHWTKSGCTYTRGESVNMRSVSLNSPQQTEIFGNLGLEKCNLQRKRAPQAKILRLVPLLSHPQFDWNESFCGENQWNEFVFDWNELFCE